jgi:type I restriction enzyme M protein
LFRGNAEAVIRKNLIKRGYIKGIIGLPANLFYGTGIPACIIVIDKEGASNHNPIFMVDGSKGFIKDGNKNRLRSQDIHKIVDIFKKRLEVERYSRLVPLDEIEKNEYNLNIPRYIDSQAVEDIQDIEGLLVGGIPSRDIDALNNYWTICPQLRKALFTDNRASYLDLAVSKDAIKPTIHEHPEFTAFMDEMERHYTEWQEENRPFLKALDIGLNPKETIFALSEKLLAHYTGKPLIDKYDVYQHLMDYWFETMQDDCYLINGDGWKAETYRVIEIGKTGKNKGKEIDKGWTCDLVTKELIVNRYFKDEQEAIRALEAEADNLTGKLTELEEEHGGEDGAFSDLEKINRANIAEKLKELKNDPAAKEEVAILKAWQKLNNQHAAIKKDIKIKEVHLDTLAHDKSLKLGVEEVKTLVVDDKWLTTIKTAIDGEIERISQTLTKRVKELADRYESPMPKLTEKVAALEGKVDRHLEKMGFRWK